MLALLLLVMPPVTEVWVEGSFGFVPICSRDDDPPTDDLSRFPDSRACTDAEEAIACCELYLTLASVYDCGAWDTWLPRARRDLWLTRLAWNYLSRAHEGGGASRRVYLAVLRDWIGEDAYGAGKMPSLPLWCYRRVP